MADTLHTTWELWSYDVWGNADDGYQVNDRCCFERSYELDLPITVYNAGTPHEFRSASVTNAQLREIWGKGCSDDGLGEGTTVYMERTKDGKPVGEMHCTSHESLTIKPD